MEWTTESPMSGIDRVMEETRRVQDLAEAAIAEAKSVHCEVDRRVAMLVAQATATTAHGVDALSKCISEVVVQSEAQTSRIVGTVAQQLEKGIEAAMWSATAMSEHNTHIAVDMCREKSRCN